MHPRPRLSIALLVLLSACSDSTGPGGKAGEGTLRLIPGIDTLAAGESVQFSARLVPDTGGLLSPGEVIWSSSDPDIASVSKGLVTGHRSGSAEIVALVRGDRATATVAVERRFKATSVAVGPYHLCALAPDGQAWCFGTDRDGSLGLGTFGGSYRTMTAPVVGGVTFRAIAVNDVSSCGLDAAGRAWCWGSNNSRELGHAPAFQYSAVPVVADTLRTYDSLSSQDRVTCGLSGGVPYCWGFNRGAPRAPLIPATPPFTSITAGRWLQCAAPSSGGVACWQSLGFSGGGAAAGTRFRAITGSYGARSDGATGGYLCGLDQSAVAWCWGSNGSGQLGDNTTIDRASAVAVTGGRAYVSISAGPDFACATDAAGVTRCWGSNDQGQLGTGAATGSLGPEPASTAERFTAVSTGVGRACGVSIAQELWCWGAGFGRVPAPVLY